MIAPKKPHKGNIKEETGNKKWKKKKTSRGGKWQ